jgi:hypothetical protein
MKAMQLSHSSASSLNKCLIYQNAIENISFHITFDIEVLFLKTDYKKNALIVEHYNIETRGVMRPHKCGNCMHGSGWLSLIKLVCLFIDVTSKDNASSVLVISSIRDKHNIYKMKPKCGM